jgi:hypothetical protein
MSLTNSADIKHLRPFTFQNLQCFQNPRTDCSQYDVSLLWQLDNDDDFQRGSFFILQ